MVNAEEMSDEEIPFRLRCNRPVGLEEREEMSDDAVIDRVQIFDIE